MEILNVIKVFAPATVSFAIGIAITPIVSHYLYKHKMWKKKVRTLATDGREAKIFSELHKNKEVGTPKMGGVIIWGSVIITTLVFWVISVLDGPLAEKLNFLSRNQTWLPLALLFLGALVGLLDDYFEVSERQDYFAGGLSASKRLAAVTVMGILAAWWFYYKLGVSTILVPFGEEMSVGVLFIPFFVLVMLGIYAGGVIDGLDGLSGGVFASIFAAYGAIAFFQGQIDLAAFSFVIVGGLLAFLWFNIPPARFYMAETGSMALTVTLTVIAFLTKQVLVLPVIAFLLVITALSSALQLASKKFRNGKKIFLVAPLHHHFEALGWPSYKVTMRYWVLSAMCATLGILIALLG